MDSLLKKATLPATLRATACCTFLLFPILGGRVFGQEVALEHDAAVTRLAELLDEAEKHNPQIQAARQG
jgi:hypothetical protein